MTDTVSLAIIPVTEEGTKSSPGLKAMGTFEGATGTYEIFGSATGKPMVSTENWRLFVAKSPSGQLGLMKISANAESNRLLENEAEVLNTLQGIAQQLNEEAAVAGETPLNYGAFFPRVLEIVTTDDSRTALMLGYHESIETYRQLFPMLIALRNQRVDMKTATWMTGKLMKLLGFVHDVGYTVGFVDNTNLFIEPKLHGVFVLDFSSTNQMPMDMDQHKEVAQAASIVWNAIGGNDENDPPFDEDLMTKAQYEQYRDLLRSAKNGEFESATKVHQALYELADTIWPKKEVAPGISKRDFHEFATYDL